MRRCPAEIEGRGIQTGSENDTIEISTDVNAATNQDGKKPSKSISGAETGSRKINGEPPSVSRNDVEKQGKYASVQNSDLDTETVEEAKASIAEDGEYGIKAVMNALRNCDQYCGISPNVAGNAGCDRAGFAEARGYSVGKLPILLQTYTRSKTNWMTMKKAVRSECRMKRRLRSRNEHPTKTPGAPVFFFAYEYDTINKRTNWEEIDMTDKPKRSKLFSMTWEPICVALRPLIGLTMRPKASIHVICIRSAKAWLCSPGNSRTDCLMCRRVSCTQRQRRSICLKRIALLISGRSGSSLLVLRLCRFLPIILTNIGMKKEERAGNFIHAACRHAGRTREYGKNTLVINEKYGNRIAFGAVLTDALVPSDPLSKRLCPENCRKCIESCRSVHSTVLPSIRKNAGSIPTARMQEVFP
jgi:anti-sigma28 factor (negative regulator of flagellin synthesis)